METLDCIRTRRSVRKYLDKTVSIHIIGQILEAGRMAPTAGNLQNYKFILVMEKPTKRAIAEACLQQYWMETAPVHIVVVSEPQRARQFYGERGEKLYSVQNCAAIVENMLLAITDRGLGGCWVGAFDNEMMRRAVGIPEYCVPQAVVTTGYADEKPVQPNRFKLWDHVFLKKWDSKISELDISMRQPSTHIAKKTKEAEKILDKHAHKVMNKIKEHAVTVHKKIKKHLDERKRKKEGKDGSGLVEV
ncbi:nitroreductase family protein [Candidatus Woesearchaeota archaeon]|nr:nitroreductase family protein [Candidatus Woesearchaeota archaeon]